jgi:fused signal recognition particle receptor
MAIQTLFGPPPPPSVFERFKKAIASTGETLGAKLEEAVRGKKEIDAALLDQLEHTLLAADLGVATTQEVLKAVRERAEKELLEQDAATVVRKIVKEELLGILTRAGSGAASAPTAEPPVVIMIVGVNGVGKTTTIGKLAHQLTQGGKGVLLCAADTFRAAANEQLEIWATRSGTTMIRQKPGADPSAVLFDALTAAKSRGLDYVIVDTAGRLHNKANLMAELDKMRRTATKLIPGAPHEVLLILDATTGQNGVSQAREFLAAAGVTGIVLTKLDGTAKGGVAVAIARELNLPIRYAGIGEQRDDLIPFDPKHYVDSLFQN